MSENERDLRSRPRAGRLATSALAPSSSPTRQRPGRMTALVVLVALVGGGTLAACSGAHDQTGGPGVAGGTGAMASMAATPSTAMSAGGEARPPADAAAAWDARPDFVRTNPTTEEAYAWALYHPEVLRWVPCYCGCGAMGHRSNLDCYLKPGAPGVPTAFEEHASYCDICVRTTLLAKQLRAEGKTLREIRAVVDRTFGGSAPGTPTDLPPA